jgi:hypothetical protein
MMDARLISGGLAASNREAYLEGIRSRYRLANCSLSLAAVSWKAASF